MRQRAFSGRLYYTEKTLWKFSWFLRDFGYDAELLNHDEVDVRALMNLRGVVRTSHAVINGRIYQNLDAFAPAALRQPEPMSSSRGGFLTRVARPITSWPFTNNLQVFPKQQLREIGSRKRQNSPRWHGGRGSGLKVQPCCTGADTP